LLKQATKGTFMSSRIFGLLVTAVCVTAFTLEGGCAPATPESMTPPLQRVARTQSGTVWVTAIGGADTNDFWDAEIGTVEFAKAVENSIEKSGVLESVSRNGSGEYHLEANLRATDMRGSDVKFKILVSWKLSRSSDHRLVWEADIVGTDSDKMANAAQDNISQAIQSLEAAIPLR
jgi:hypothetical protein